MASPPINDTDPVDRATFDGAYKRVTDALTLYVWREPAFHLTRWAARVGVSPNVVTAIGAFFCLLTFLLFWSGHYWIGLACALAAMLLDSVDGTLARCTGMTSRSGAAFDRAIDLVVPPFWWWAWEHGLAAYGRPLAPVYATMVLWTIIGGYVGRRAIEWIFIRRSDGMGMHSWRPIDSKFRFITAGRSANLLILTAALLLARPDAGLVVAALWTLVSLIFHAVRLAQASEQVARGARIVSWIEP